MKQLSKGIEPNDKSFILPIIKQANVVLTYYQYNHCSIQFNSIQLYFIQHNINKYKLFCKHIYIWLHNN